jgi:hypothetical protein
MPSLRQHLTERDLSVFKRACFAPEDRRVGAPVAVPERRAKAVKIERVTAPALLQPTDGA